MPNRPLRPCTAPGCPVKVPAGRCPECVGRADLRRREKDKAYHTAAWERFRLDYLIRHPWCRLCRRIANTPDHYPRARRELVAAGVLDPDQDQYVRPLCGRCHSRQTSVNQPGGWHAARR